MAKAVRDNPASEPQRRSMEKAAVPRWARTGGVRITRPSNAREVEQTGRIAPRYDEQFRIGPGERNYVITIWGGRRGMIRESAADVLPARRRAFRAVAA
jgi:hypothetical protein